MRRSGGGSRDKLMEQCDLALEHGQIDLDEFSLVYFHLAVHAGVVKPANLLRFHICPVCEAKLDIPEVERL